MNNPNISVIIALYNAETTIQRCLNSLIAQTYTCWEAIDFVSKKNNENNDERGLIFVLISLQKFKINAV